MFHHFKLSLTLLLMTSILISGCEFKDVELERVEKFEITNLDKGQLDATITLVLNNPNAFPITVKSGDFQIFSGNVRLGEAHLVEKLKIKSNTVASYDVRINGEVGDLMGAGLAGLASFLSGKKPEMTVKGELHAGNLFYSRVFPVELKTEIPLGF